MCLILHGGCTEAMIQWRYSFWAGSFAYSWLNTCQSNYNDSKSNQKSYAMCTLLIGVTTQGQVLLFQFNRFYAWAPIPTQIIFSLLTLLKWQIYIKKFLKLWSSTPESFGPPSYASIEDNAGMALRKHSLCQIQWGCHDGLDRHVAYVPSYFLDTSFQKY